MASGRHRARPALVPDTVRPGRHGEDVARTDHRRGDQGRSSSRSRRSHRALRTCAKAIEAAGARLAMSGQRTILFVDEIHRFTKSQQDALLHAVEDRLVVLVGATTENPFFEVNAPLISRSRIVELTPLSDEDVREIVHRALADERGFSGRVTLDPDAEDAIVITAGRRRPNGPDHARARRRVRVRRRRRREDASPSATSAKRARRASCPTTRKATSTTTSSRRSSSRCGGAIPTRRCTGSPG